MFLRWWRDRRRRTLAAEPFPAEWLAIVRTNCRHFAMLNEAEQAHLLRDTRWFLAEKTIEAAVGLAQSDEIRVTIAVQASLLGLGFVEPPFDRLMTVFVQAESYTGVQVYRDSSGLELHSEQQRLGEAWRNGPIVLSWRDILQQCRESPDGRNVILHEFAHVLDMANYDVDGVPPLDNEQQYRTWIDVTGAEYQRLVRQSQLGRETLLDEYGATSPAEFFAVATESFFEQPVEFSRLHVRLYDVLRAFYKQDPASRVILNSQQTCNVSGLDDNAAT